MDKTNVMVKFAIIGDEFDSNVVTEKLNITPDQYWFKGDAIDTRPIKRKETAWIINTGYEESLDINDQLSKIVNLISDKKSALIELKTIYKLEYIFGIVVNVENGQTPAIYFTGKFIEFAHEIGAEFYIDLYIY